MKDRDYAGRWHVLAAVLLGSIMGPIDASIVYIAMPAIARVFGVDPATVGWVSMAYLLVLGSFLLSFGRLGDMFGFKRLFLIGLLIFVVTSALCGLAPGLGWLIFLRALQATGAGMTMAMSPAIITAAFPPQERGRALGMNGMIMALGLAVGPSLGGLLVDTLGWRAIFYVNVPIGVAAYLWCRRILPDVRSEKRQSFDWPGALLAFCGLGALLLFASQGEAAGWSWPILLLGVVALVLLGEFIVVEKRSDEPMLDLKLFQSRVFSAGNGAALLNFMTQYVIVFLTPFFLQQVVGYSAGRAGTIMTAFPLTVLVVAPLAGALSDKIGQRGLAFTGSLICTVAALAMAGLNQQSGPGDVAWRLSMFGLGTGLFQSPNNSAVMGAVPKFRLGIAGGVLATTRNVGMVLGIALGGAILTTRQAAYLDLGRSDAFLAGLQEAYLTAMFLSLIGTLVCLWVGPPRSE
ncbi:EmrB/QacA subfamily drug resistance transporter [Desulfofundulus luciae]|uniref:EmrB/QacA subfamily drug resistance transporter n=1 Tax=Desulfofundulus luciae TaxID=74702 RepID=A0ABU0B397_9FIRM|nr:MFS transporter [Desulfofundulus luciae]MDQ0287188.1 EmrB/QacA subfamily drug resistance transporter [Desulfofundulus luciae]